MQLKVRLPDAASGTDERALSAACFARLFTGRLAAVFADSTLPIRGLVFSPRDALDFRAALAAKRRAIKLAIG